jgi:ribosome-associated protein
MNRETLRESILQSSRFEFSRSGGPGGQNVNKVNTKAGIRIALSALKGISEIELSLVRERLSGRIDAEGDILVTVSDERSQSMNRAIALERLEDLIVRAAKRKPPRFPTKPTRASRERRLDSKKTRGATKKGRGRPDGSGD